MEKVFEAVSSMWSQVFYAVCHITVFDLIDILVIAYLVYKAIGFLRETRAGQLVKGIAILIIVALLARLLKLVSLQWLLSTVFESALIAVAIIFQPELRRALEKVGRSNFGSFVKGQTPVEERENATKCIEAVCQAAAGMSKQKVGALIVFERNTLLGDIVNTGTLIDASASPQMIANVFYPKSPLHDGAMIVRDGRILAAGCILPLTQNGNISLSLGTRHRAAIGMSENSDAVVVVISEETGIVSVATNGNIVRNYTTDTLREKLIAELLNEQQVKREGLVLRIKSLVKDFFKGKNNTDNKETGREE